ncbi:MAG: hypothetical protein CMJ18_25525 [Phycisphaeraceae bacterium]|nr:hypothetical protein [Phycisphaeraceae bacterium]
MARPTPSCLLLLVSLIVAAATAPAPAADDEPVRQEFELDEGEWAPTRVFDPASPEGRLQAARHKLAEGRAKSAEKLATNWIEQYPNHPRLVEAYLVRADALVARRRYFKSLFDYEYIIRVFPESMEFQTALEREYEIARLFAAGMRRVWLGLRILPASAEAEELYIRIQERSPGSPIAEKASLALGEFYFTRSEMPNAAEAYDLFLQNYPRSRHRERAILRLIQSNLATFQGPKFDATGLIEAAQRLKMFETEFPVSARRLGSEALLSRIEESLALKEYIKAGWYERIGQRVSAIFMYRRVIQDHQGTVAALASLERLEKLGAPFDPEAAPPAPEPGTETAAPDKST